MSDEDATNKPRCLLNRRGALVAMAVAGGLGVWWAWPRIARQFVGAFGFEPLDDPTGFRRIAIGETSGIPSPFFGLDAPHGPDGAMPEAAMRADQCGGLFGGPPPAGVVPIASFSD